MSRFGQQNSCLVLSGHSTSTVTRLGLVVTRLIQRLCTRVQKITEDEQPSWLEVSFVVLLSSVIWMSQQNCWHAALDQLALAIVTHQNCTSHLNPRRYKDYSKRLVTFIGQVWMLLFMKKPAAPHKMFLLCLELLFCYSNAKCVAGQWSFSHTLMPTKVSVTGFMRLNGRTTAQRTSKRRQHVGRVISTLVVPWKQLL